jgi:histidinol-phosphate aminotransferase
MIHGRGSFAVCINAYGPAPTVRAAIIAASIDDYPDPDCVAACEAASARWSRPIEEIACGAGTAELIQTLALALLRPGDRVVIPRPAFSEYGRAALLAGARVHRATHEELTAAIREHRPRLAFVAAPTSPAGLALSRSARSPMRAPKPARFSFWIKPMMRLRPSRWARRRCRGIRL